MPTSAQNERATVLQMKSLVDDLFGRRAGIYWADMLVTVAVGYGAALAFLQAQTGSAAQVGSLAVAAFALFRAGSYIHEIAHMRTGEMRAFRAAWNILCGIPMLTPTTFYANHVDHHSHRHYGTAQDGEYLPLGAGPLRALAGFWAQVPLLPVYFFMRFAVVAPISFLHPTLRRWVLERMSSFVMNFRHRLRVRPGPERPWDVALEIACCLRAWSLIGAMALVGWTYLLQMYGLAVAVLSLNYLRNMAAHHYRNTGGEISHLEQLADSVNITGHPILTELLFPLGLRYHALHHLLPSLPYHNLGKAHRRLASRLPADSPYHATVYPSFRAVMRVLISDARASPGRQQLRARSA